MQGYLWRDGYENGVYATPLFADVAQCLKDWYAEGLRLGIYSSGSVFAQRLLFGHVRIDGEEDVKGKTSAAAGEKRGADDVTDAEEATAEQPPSKKVAADAGGEKAESRDDGRPAALEKHDEGALEIESKTKVATEDLQYLISDWFDTSNAGSKKESSSYAKIAKILKVRDFTFLALRDILSRGARTLTFRSSLHPRFCSSQIALRSTMQRRQQGLV